MFDTVNICLGLGIKKWEQKNQEVEWEPPGLWVLTLADLLILLSRGQRKNVPLFLHAVDVGIGGVAPLEVQFVLLEDFVEFFGPSDVLH